MVMDHQRAGKKHGTRYYIVTLDLKLQWNSLNSDGHQDASPVAVPRPTSTTAIAVDAISVRLPSLLTGTPRSHPVRVSRRPLL